MDTINTAYITTDMRTDSLTGFGWNIYKIDLSMNPPRMIWNSYGYGSSGNYPYSAASVSTHASARFLMTIGNFY